MEKIGASVLFYLLCNWNLIFIATSQLIVGIKHAYQHSIDSEKILILKAKSTMTLFMQTKKQK